MRYSRRTSNYPEKITLYDAIHMLSVANLITINVEILTIDSWFSLKKEFMMQDAVVKTLVPDQWD